MPAVEKETYSVDKFIEDICINYVHALRKVTYARSDNLKNLLRKLAIGEFIGKFIGNFIGKFIGKSRFLF